MSGLWLSWFITEFGEIRFNGQSSAPMQLLLFYMDRIVSYSDLLFNREASICCRYFNNFFEGEFVLYRHKTLPYAVHTFYRRCNGRASCNCAVAVKAGDDVLLVDKCGPTESSTGGFYPITVELFRNGILTPGFQILSYYEGRKIKVGWCQYCALIILSAYSKVWTINTSGLQSLFNSSLHDFASLCVKKNLSVLLLNHLLKHRGGFQ